MWARPASFYRDIAGGIVEPESQRLKMATFTLTLDPQERAYLEGLLEIDLGETRVELRRTETPALHDELHQRENLIRGLLTKLRGDKPSQGAGPRP
jgi:hypothetical protein